MLNNYNPGYLADGTSRSGQFAVPPQSPKTYPTIGDELSAHNVSWGYFGQDWNDGNPNLAQYCNICNPFQYATSIMTSAAQRKAHLHGLAQFQSEAGSGSLPAVSIVKPEGTFDGHAGYSTLAAFEAFASTVIADIAQNPSEWRSTAIFVTMDEGGGYYDSGYIQPTSFFGDGTRVPMIAVSPWVEPGHIDHTYTDHVSVLKFIEANWGLHPLSASSLDNLPNPVANASDPYVPTNGPAIGNLMSLFDFHRSSTELGAERVALLDLTAHHTLRPFARATVTAPDATRPRLTDAGCRPHAGRHPAIRARVTVPSPDGHVQDGGRDHQAAEEEQAEQQRGSDSECAIRALLARSLGGDDVCRDEVQHLEADGEQERTGPEGAPRRPAVGQAPRDQQPQPAVGEQRHEGDEHATIGRPRPGGARDRREDQEEYEHGEELGGREQRRLGRPAAVIHPDQPVRDDQRAQDAASGDEEEGYPDEERVPAGRFLRRRSRPTRRRAPQGRSTWQRVAGSRRRRRQRCRDRRWRPVPAAAAR